MDAETNAVVVETVAGNEVMPMLLTPLRRKIKQVYADGAYDTKACHVLLGANALIQPRKNAAMWVYGHPRNEAVVSFRVD